MLEESLRMLGAKRMIVAHSVQDSITARCDGKVWAVDVGMSRYYGGEVQVLEIVNDEVVSVISRRCGLRCHYATSRSSSWIVPRKTTKLLVL